MSDNQQVDPNRAMTDDDKARMEAMERHGIRGEWERLAFVQGWCAMNRRHEEAIATRDAELAEARGEVARLRGMLRDASAGMRRFGSLLRLIGKQDDNAGALVEGNTAYERADEIDAALTPPPAAPEEVDGAQS